MLNRGNKGNKAVRTRKNKASGLLARRKDDQSSEATASSSLVTTRLDYEHPRTEQISFTPLININEEKKRLEKRKKVLGWLEEFNKEDSTLFKSDDTVVREILENQSDDCIIKLNIGGKIFTTTRHTLNKRENMLKVMINSEFSIDRDENGCIVVADRNPNYFPIILEHIRTGSTKYIGLLEEYPSEESLDELRNLLEESDFFGTQKLSNVVAFKIKQDAKLLSNTNQEQKKEEIEESEENEENTLLSRDVAHLTQNEKELAEKYIEEKEKELGKLREEVKELDEKTEKPSKKFNVRGVQFEIGIEKLVAHPEFVLTILCRERRSDEVIFIDRDPSTFGILVEYLNTEDFNVIPKEISKRKLVYKMVKEFNLVALLEYLDPLRYPFELLGETNLKIKKNEDFLRNIYSTERNHPILQDPRLHLIEIFGDGASKLFKKRELPPAITPLFDFEDEKEATELCQHSQVSKPTIPQLCDSIDTFQKQFDAFTSFLFKDINWDNMVCAGGGILNCMLQADIKETPIDDKEESLSYDDPKEKPYWTEDDESNDDSHVSEESDYFTSSGDEEYIAILTNPPKAKNPEKDSPEKKLYAYYRNNFQKSDIDIFLYDLDEKQAKEKIVYIYEHLKKQLASIPTSSYLKYGKPKKSDECNDILIIRTQNAITFIPHPGFRKVQIILRIYKSPAEVLIGFDIPSCCVGYDGKSVLALPRAVQAISTRCNIVDPDRQSNTYETRLVKYALRGFKIGVPAFSEKKVSNRVLTDKNSIKTNWSPMRTSPTANINQVTGLARILLIRHAMKNCERKKGALWSIGGGRTLENTEKKLNHQSKAYYTDITSEFSYYNPPKYISSRLDRKINGIRRYGHRDPQFHHSLNDITPIVYPDSSKKNRKSHLPFHTLNFITINPGTQSIGSFYPHTKNFFKDAYSSPSRLKKSKNKYYWRDSNKKYSKEISKKLEIQYRRFAQTRSVNDVEFHLEDNQFIDFRNFCIYDKVKDQKGRKYVGNVFRTKDSRKIIKRSNPIPQIDHQAVLFGEDESDTANEVVVDDEKVPYFCHRYAAREETFKVPRHFHHPHPVSTSSDDENEEFDHGDDDDDYEDYEDYEEEYDDDDDDFHPSQMERIMMMNALLMNQRGKGGNPPDCSQQ